MRLVANVRPRFRSSILVGLIALGAAVASLGAPRDASASAFGPGDNFCGNPPINFNCTLCHGDYAANSGDGGLSIEGLPTSFVPGNAYDLLVRIYDPGQMRWGFELTVLDAANQQAGDLVVLDLIRTQLSDNGGTSADFLKHTYGGTEWGTPNGPVTWPFRWVAPNQPTVTFYFAGNAADGTEDPGNDFIYVRQAVLSQATTAAEPGTWGQVKSLFAGN